MVHPGRARAAAAVGPGRRARSLERPLGDEHSPGHHGTSVRVALLVPLLTGLYILRAGVLQDQGPLARPGGPHPRAVFLFSCPCSPAPTANSTTNWTCQRAGSPSRWARQARRRRIGGIGEGPHGRSPGRFLMESDVGSIARPAA
jgi:hypothetical protein